MITNQYFLQTLDFDQWQSLTNQNAAHPTNKVLPFFTNTA